MFNQSVKLGVFLLYEKFSNKCTRFGKHTSRKITIPSNNIFLNVILQRNEMVSFLGINVKLQVLNNKKKQPKYDPEAFP